LDIDDVAVQQDAARLAKRHECSLVSWPGSAGGWQIRAGSLLPDVRVCRRTAWPGEAALRPLEPVVNLACANRVFVFPIAAAGGGAIALADGADHHQVMPESRLRPESVELWHRLQHPRVIAGLKPLHPVGISRGGLGSKDVFDPGGLVLAQFPPPPESVAERTRSQQHDPAVTLFDCVSQGPAEPEVVLRISGLAYPDGDPPLVRQALAEELPQIGGGVEDRQVIIGDCGDPSAVIVCLGRNQLSELRTPQKVVGPMDNSPWQFRGGEQTLPPLLRGNDELDRGSPVGVQYDDGVVVEVFEDLAAQLVQAGDQRRVLSVVQLATDLLRQHDCRYMRDQTRAYYLAHARLPFALDALPFRC